MLSRDSWAVIAEINKTTAEMMAKFMAILNECAATPAPMSLQISSGATRISAMPPFDWTRDKAIYQRLQSWSKKARHALDVIEGDIEGQDLLFPPLD